MSLINNISNLTDDSSFVCMKFTPISSTIPADRPKIKDINKKFYSCKIILVKDNIEYDMTDWFSVPKSNLNSILDVRRINGVSVLIVDNIDDSDRENILDDSYAVFNINNEINNNVLRWLDNK